MGFLGVLNFALPFIHLLAWPLFALAYPLCASIRAIETNSNYHMQKLVTYWILYSLISLFELAFVKLIEWIPLWPYIKLGIICWLVLPRFKGAHYCYKSFIQPCLSVSLEEAMKRLYKRPKASVEKDNFLTAAERYLIENGTEALEKLITSRGSRTGFGVEDIKPVAEAGIQEMPLKVKGSRTDFGIEKIKVVAEVNKLEMPQMVKTSGNELKVEHKIINRTELPVKSALISENLAKKKTITTVEVKEKTIQPVPTAATMEALPAKNPLENVQKEWTCALCQVKASCEANLNSHLAGKKHWEKCQDLSKTMKQTTKVNAGPSSPASKGVQILKNNKGSMELSYRDRLSQIKTKKSNEKVQVKVISEASKKNADVNSNSVSNNFKRWCSLCGVMCKSEIDFSSHLNGKRHKASLQEIAQG